MAEHRGSLWDPERPGRSAPMGSISPQGPRQGHPDPIGRFPTEKTPHGKFLLSVGMDPAGTTVYAIDQASRELKRPVGHYPMGTQPNWIEIVDLKS
jgi:hypothetical protein